MARLFGTDGIRGEAGNFPLDAPTVRAIGYSLARHLKGRDKRPFIVTGRDTRESGEWIEGAMIAGARLAGARCDSAGIITTPGVAFLARSLGAHAGVVISASHNPYQDNGIKIFEPSGKKLNDVSERLIEADIQQGADNKVGEDSTAFTGEPVVDQQTSEKLKGLYRQYLTEEIGRDLSLKGLTLVVDCANGAASKIAPELFRNLGARVIPINNTPDGRNINRNCGSLFIDELRERTAAESADLGVAFDGDADRALFVDSMGGFVDGDATLWILAQYLKERGALHQNIVIATVMSNLGLEIALKKINVHLVRTDVGDKYVLEELTRTGAAIGGEQSGHIILPQLSLAGDGIITTLSVLRAVQESHQKVVELASGFQRLPQVLMNVPVRRKRPFEELPEVASLVRHTQERLGAKGRLLLRYSGTEALARVMIEGETQVEIDAYARALAETISKTLGSPS